MTLEERARMKDLCAQIATEKDSETFDRLVRELNDLLEQRQERIHPDHKPN